MARESNAMAYIAEITNIKPIDGADAIECATINGGWQVVVKKNEFKVGDYVVYCELDSFIPNSIAPFLSKGKEPREYNGVKGERLRTIRLRGQISQGLVLPLSVLPKGIEFLYSTYVGDVLGIQKWEPPVDARLGGMAKGNFPSWIPKTDQPRCQNIIRTIENEVLNESIFECSIKMDGSSITVYKNGEQSGICSRNIDLKVDEEDNQTNTFIATAKSTGLYEAVKQFPKNIAVQGELVGGSIQGNSERITDGKFHIFVFDIFDIDEQKYLGYGDRMHIMAELRKLGAKVEHVPVEGIMKLPTANLDELLKMAEGPGLFTPVREGLVFKRIDGKFSFKVVSNSWLLKNG